MVATRHFELNLEIIVHFVLSHKLNADYIAKRYQSFENIGIYPGPQTLFCMEIKMDDGSSLNYLEWDFAMLSFTHVHWDLKRNNVKVKCNGSWKFVRNIRQFTLKELAKPSFEMEHFLVDCFVIEMLECRERKIVSH